MTRGHVWLVAVLMLASALIGAGTASLALMHRKVVTAQAFRLVDRDGKLRATLGLGPEGSAGLAVRDNGDVDRVVMYLQPDGSPAVSLADRDGQQRAVLGCLAPPLTPTGSIQVGRESSLVLFDKDGKVIWKTP